LAAAKSTAVQVVKQAVIVAQVNMTKHDLQYQASTDRGHIYPVYCADCKYRKMGTAESLYSELNGTDGRSVYRNCRIKLN
jgi:hypothetical protein